MTPHRHSNPFYNGVSVQCICIFFKIAIFKTRCIFFRNVFDDRPCYGMTVTPDTMTYLYLVLLTSSPVMKTYGTVPGNVLSTWSDSNLLRFFDHRLAFPSCESLVCIAQSQKIMKKGQIVACFRCRSSIPSSCM